MSRLFEFFQNHDTNQCFPIDLEIDFTFQNNSSSIDNSTDNSTFNLKVIQRTLLNPIFDSRIILFYIPKCVYTFDICIKIIENIEEQIKRSFEVEITSQNLGEYLTGTRKQSDVNKIIFYTEIPLSIEEINFLAGKSYKDLLISFRSIEFMNKRLELQKPFAFISHDSKNKDLIARPLAQGLNSRLCYVWYDEFSLKVGDSLRSEIEKGLKEAKKCILIITPEFINNPGWVKTEFDSIFTREIILKENIILPIWYNVNQVDVYNFCPSLADKFALVWPDPNKLSEYEYKNEIEILISKIHLAINS